MLNMAALHLPVPLESACVPSLLGEFIIVCRSSIEFNVSSMDAIAGLKFRNLQFRFLSWLVLLTDVKVDRLNFIWYVSTKPASNNSCTSLTYFEE